ncbi:MAG: hypothetical protein AMS19_02535 [Gemmatimonas sp. SG8_23]|jgi:hypothetical protein|nr:MAG: hypothetical protein AMS19_02535 [Gemmatimonas sp. SG8_23]
MTENDQEVRDLRLRLDLAAESIRRLTSDLEIATKTINALELEKRALVAAAGERERIVSEAINAQNEIRQAQGVEIERLRAELREAGVNVD